MATLARRLLTVDEFLEIEFDPGTKAELSNGVVRVLRMMSGGSRAHARVQRNILMALGNKLRGSGCCPYGSDLAVQPNEMSLRYPDVSVVCGGEGIEHDKELVVEQPRMVVEVLSPSTRYHDEHVKLVEYCAMPSLDVILYVDPDKETVRLLTRTPAHGWADRLLDKAEGVTLDAFGITLSWDEIFARAS